jgi:hypothetical protein
MDEKNKNREVVQDVVHTGLFRSRFQQEDNLTYALGLNTYPLIWKRPLQFFFLNLSPSFFFVPF